MAESEETGMSFAERMMKNMGWSQGKGLGKEEEGMKDFIKPKMKFNTKGIGFMGVDNKWIAHQEHFDDLLTSLNKGEKPAEKKDIACLTSASKLRGRTKFYAKMMRGKDLSNRSSQDLGAIILPLSKKDEVQKPETSMLPSETDGTLKSSQVSMNDYFAKMMAQRKSKTNEGKSSDAAIDLAGSSGDSEGQETAPNEPKRDRKRKAKADDHVSAESSPQLNQEVVDEGSHSTKKKKKRRSEKVDLVECDDSSDRALVVDDAVGVATEEELPPGSKRKSKKSRKLSVSEVEAASESKAEEKVKKSKKRRSPEPAANEVPEETHTEDTGVKRKKKKSRREGSEETLIGDVDQDVVVVEDDTTQTKKAKKKGSKQKHSEVEFEITEHGTRLNIDVDLLKEIRGPKLAKSKAEPVTELTDDQIQEIHRMWSSGEYAEFMRRVHAGELPRWVAVEKSQVDSMMMGRTKFIDLAAVRDVVQTKWNNANVEEIWGYTNVAYLAV